MRLAPRWKKLVGDFNAAQGRIGLMVGALGIGVFALTTIAGAYSILDREIARNYLATNPASALIDVGTATPDLVREIAADPQVEAAEAASIVMAQAQDSMGKWQRTLLFVAPNGGALSIGRVLPEAGDVPAPAGSVAMEREALAFLGLGIGDAVTIALPGHAPVRLPIAGRVHDPSLAPAWQEQTAYGYISEQTLVQLGGAALPELVKVKVRDAIFDQARTDAVIAGVALRLEQQGVVIHQVQIPPTGRHPHQSQMTGVLGMFLVFAALALLLSAVLTATMVAGLLAQQVRQIAIMKAIGARTGQIAALYFAGMAVVAVAATAIAVPLGLYAASGFAGVIAQLLNFDLASALPPVWLEASLVLVGIVLPLVFVALPIRRATQATVREALADQGISRASLQTDPVQRLLARLTGLDRTVLLALRNAFRKRGRLWLNLALLGAAGAMFIAALDVEAAWRSQLAEANATRDYSVEIRFTQPIELGRIEAALATAPGIAELRPADFEAAAAGRADGLMIVRTYPDGGHGSLSVRPASALPRVPELIAGGAEPGAGVVLNQQAWSLLGRPPTGTAVALLVEGHGRSFVLSGVVREILQPASAYLAAPGFADLTGHLTAVAAVRLVAADPAPAAVEQLAVTAREALSRANIDVELLITEATLEAAQGGHVTILIVALIAMAVIMAAVGAIGLASSQGSNVTERIREFGIMRTIGASGGAVMHTIVAEGLAVALLSLPLALLVGLPLGYGIGVLVGTLAFGLALPLTISGLALALWLALLVVGSVMASLAPGRRAARLTIRQTLAHN